MEEEGATQVEVVVEDEGATQAEVEGVHAGVEVVVGVQAWVEEAGVQLEVGAAHVEVGVVEVDAV